MKSLTVIDQQLADLSELKVATQKRAGMLTIKSKFDRVILAIYPSGNGTVTFSDYFGADETDIELSADKIERIKDSLVKTVMDKLNGEVK
ncbi:hypothetical protein [Oenococcus sicerae]|uniref:hypothetical protein n=1 Tax=Oenococcus sicerae TaxID=2203724 RepID=UPI0039E730BA